MLGGTSDPDRVASASISMEIRICGGTIGVGGDVGKCRALIHTPLTPAGQVLWMEGERTIFDLFVERERELAKTRPELTEDLVRRVTGVRSLDALPAPKVEIAMKGDADNELPRRLILHPEPGIVLPALYWPGGEKAPLLLAPDNGMNSAVADARQRHADPKPHSPVARSIDRRMNM